MSKLAVLIFCGALVWLAGCATEPPEPPPDWSITNEVQTAQHPVQVNPVLPETPTNPAAVRTNLPGVKTNPPPAVVTNSPPATNHFQPPPAPILTWTSLSRWAAAHKMSQPRLLAKSPLTTYAITSDKGNMVLAIGSREAIWNGVTIHLGFPPEFIDGQVFVHGLDLQKSLEPFLCNPPPTFGTNRLIVVDAGHGGMNGGTVSVSNRRPEKEYTLDWARRLKPLLESNGWTVVLTRTNDVDIALSNRVNVAENQHADLFISLHFNSVAPDQKPLGLATFCLTPVGMPSTVTRGFPDMLFQSFPNNSFDTQNMQLAERLQRSLVRVTGLEDHGVNRARYIGVLRGQRRPAVLIEAGFLSNPREAKRIEQAEFRQKLAEAVANALK